MKKEEIEKMINLINDINSENKSLIKDIRNKKEFRNVESLQVFIYIKTHIVTINFNNVENNRLL